MKTQKTHLTRKLRQDQTPWEIKLWNTLKNRGIGNLKFRRQYKIGDYVVDFFCPSKKLIIELDGGQHNLENYQVKDQERQKHLQSQGYKVLRFWNNEIDDNLEGVIEKIFENI